MKRSVNKIRYYAIHEWPLSISVPDMVRDQDLYEHKLTANEYKQVNEVKHYMMGLAHIHLQKRSVVWRINMAYDVLYNEVSHTIFI